MQQRQLGPGGPAVSAVGIGAMSFAGFYGPATEEESHAVLAAALDLGIDHIDTANVYGMGLSERIVGSFLARQGKAREGRFRLATKAGITRDAEGRRGFDNSAEHLTAELDASLQRLGVEAVDLYYVHRRDQSIPIEEVAGTLAGFVAAGKIHSFGFSEIAPASLRRAALEHPVAAVQSEYSLQTRSPELGLVQSCEALGASLVAFSPVGRGLLTDSPPTAEAIAASSFLSVNPRFAEPANYAANLKITEGYRKLAAELGTTAAALAIAWLLYRSPTVIAIPGTRSVDHLKELAAGAALKLSAADLDRIEHTLPAGWTHGDRYAEAQWIGPERYC
ncbi:aldo/keto reductase [Pelagibius sp.]|uniref:aldo/keto reductase n=1 Tax=Pelagibius sp. TaxID=1931238 RepID=UPI00261B64CA|nr:aldo/keto reductase [Pelagibius sp.]